MIYLDNAATSWPKPEAVYEAVDSCMRNKGANPGRSGHRLSLLAGQVIQRTRDLIGCLFNIPGSSSQIVFTSNATEALNLGIKGILKQGDHVIISSQEHNSVVRPLESLRQKGMIEISKIPTSPSTGILSVDIEEAIKPNTRLIILSHASNVTGVINPIGEIGCIARNNGVLFMVDCAQTAGSFPINVQEMNIDMLAFCGHKGLFGPQGTGGLYVRNDLKLVPLKEGGTGGDSISPIQPEQSPERYESGTLNTPGIAGLEAGIEFILNEGIEMIRNKEKILTERLLSGLKAISGVIVYGPNLGVERAPLVSFNIEGIESEDVSFILDKVYNIASRPGFHCAPDAHKSIGTLDRGTVRLSIGYFNNLKEVDTCLEAIAKHRKGGRNFV